MKRLIVNADDLGFAEGVNRGIVEAHKRGIVTSASLMVDRRGADDGAAIARRTPNLSVGLHAVLDRGDELTVGSDDCHTELARFEQLVGGGRRTSTRTTTRSTTPIATSGSAPSWQPSPTPRTCRCASAPCAIAPTTTARGRSGTTTCSRSSAGSRTAIPSSAVTPGYAAGLNSRYTSDREDGARTLTDPRVRVHLDEVGVELIGWSEL